MDRVKLNIKNLREQLGLADGEELTMEKLSFLGHVSAMISDKEGFFKIQEARIISVKGENDTIRFVGIESYFLLPLNPAEQDDVEERILTVRD